MYRLLLCIFFSTICTVWAQGAVQDSVEVSLPLDIYEQLSRKDSVTEGTVFLYEDEDVRELVKLHVSRNTGNGKVNGYRIQIFSGSSYDYSVEKVTEMKEAFRERFPDIPVYLDYYDPDFKIRAGNFRNRLESIPILRLIRKVYPSSYPVKTEIPLTEIINQGKEEKEEE